MTLRVPSEMTTDKSYIISMFQGAYLKGLYMYNKYVGKTCLLFALIALISLSTGCASLTKGSTQTVPISSDPTGANVTVDGNFIGTTPVTFEMKRKNDHLVTIQKQNYSTQAIPLVKSIGGAVWGNILAGGLIGWGVDAATGAQYNLDPKTIFVRLEPAIQDAARGSAPIAAESASLGIQKLNDLDLMHENKQISDAEFALGRKAIIEQYFPELIPAAQ